MRITRPNPTAFLATLIMAQFVTPGSGLAVEQPNLVVILCDDLGYGDLACYGHSTIRTPHLDRLAGEGLRLTDCYSASPLCSPARAGLLTGRTPSRLGIYSWIPEKSPMHLQRDETTIASLLNDAGYDTCHVGKWHLNGHFNNPRQAQPHEHGFEHWFATHNNAKPSHENPENFVRNGEPVGQQNGFSCQLVADEAIHWLTLRQARDEQLSPFFLFVCFHEPHEPVASPNNLVAGYPLAKNDDQAQYFANVENMDRATGRLVRAIDELGYGKETLIILTSDNGPETLNRYHAAYRSYGSPGPLRGMKLHIYDGGIRVPGIARWTGKIKADRVSGVPVSAVDLLPTMCELADMEVPTTKTLDGTSLVPLLNEGSINRQKPLFWHYLGAYHNRQVAIRDGDWKLVAGWDGPPSMSPASSKELDLAKTLKGSKLVQFELYNIRNDIAETTDLTETEPERFAEMKAIAQKMYQEVIDEAPDWGSPLESSNKRASPVAE